MAGHTGRPSPAPRVRSGSLWSPWAPRALWPIHRCCGQACNSCPYASAPPSASITASASSTSASLSHLGRRSTPRRATAAAVPLALLAPVPWCQAGPKGHAAHPAGSRSWPHRPPPVATARLCVWGICLERVQRWWRSVGRDFLAQADCPVWVWPVRSTFRSVRPVCVGRGVGSGLLVSVNFYPLLPTSIPYLVLSWPVGHRTFDFRFRVVCVNRKKQGVRVNVPAVFRNVPNTWGRIVFQTPGGGSCSGTLPPMCFPSGRRGAARFPPFCDCMVRTKKTSACVNVPDVFRNVPNTWGWIVFQTPGGGSCSGTLPPMCSVAPSGRPHVSTFL